MRYLFLLLGGVVPLSLVSAQFLHTPDDIQHLMADSKIQFVLEQKPSFSHSITFYDSSTFADSNLMTAKGTEKSQKKGDDFLKKKNYQAALTVYKELIQTTPHSTLLPKITTCFLELEAYQEGVRYLLETGRDHPQLRRPAAFQIAQLYLANDQQSEAIQYITRIHLQSPRDRETFIQLQQVYAAAGLKIEDWQLVPEAHFNLLCNSDTSEVVIQYLNDNSPWLAYANCQALWHYQARYAADMSRISTASPEIIEWKECLLNGLISWEKLPAEQQKSHPEFTVLAKVLEQQMVNTYLLYEIHLRRGLLQYEDLSEQDISQLMRYLSTLRVTR